MSKKWNKAWWAPVQDPRQKVERIQTSQRRLILELAARAYELEKGTAPRQAADLVPAYIRTIPKDPATGQELVLPN